MASKKNVCKSLCKFIWRWFLWTLLKNIVFSQRTTSQLTGNINRYNCIFLSLFSFFSSSMAFSCDGVGCGVVVLWVLVSSCCGGDELEVSSNVIFFFWLLFVCCCFWWFFYCDFRWLVGYSFFWVFFLMMDELSSSYISWSLCVGFSWFMKYVIFFLFRIEIWIVMVSIFSSLLTVLCLMYQGALWLLLNNLFCWVSITLILLVPRL